ncbi:hypothetical protein AB835_09500 [Candidatus Endobugula sertula]|uniref:HTH gntR-type domain-containing protein n=1 Tax=Candidatus Endobugula sertula TaxID=62101 RepID=A0A1D2QNZ6_9GAMM|nr:hypothetical protein AB835_09500 [Candidatus Endobugula sertula]
MNSDQATALKNDSTNFASRVLTQLKQDILVGFFSPGEKLKMTRLKERYQVGVSPLREALSQLLAEQLVVVENQRGFCVYPISLSEMLDIYETRAHIEALAVRQAIEKGGDDWEAGIVATAHQLKKAGDLLDKDETGIQKWEVRHQAFHTAVASGCQSLTLLQVRRSLYEKASRYRNLWLKQTMVDPDIYHTNSQEHDQLVKALLERDPQTATTLIQQHLQSPSESLQKAKPSIFG